MPWNKIQKQLKNMLLKDLSVNKTRTVVTNFYLKSYNNSFDLAKIYLTLLFHKYLEELNFNYYHTC